MSTKDRKMPYQDLRMGRYSHEEFVYSITTVTLGRTPYFSDFTLARIVVREMKALHDEQYINSLAWVLMPDHLHWLLELRDKSDLSMAMKRFKAYSARSINLRLGRAGSIWQPSFYDHAIRRDEDLRKVARYIVANPLRAGLVSEIGDFPHWDAVWM